MTNPGEFVESTLDTKNEVARVSKIISAPPAAIFELLANPAMHAVIDGSGNVKAAQSDAPQRLALGTKFGMSMRMGVPYKITNEVVEFEENHRIAWRHFGGHIWRYVLEPVPGRDDATKVTEEFDWKKNKSKLMLKAMGAFSKNHKSIEKTLDRMQAHFTSAQ
jgi:uncharacterized protein YndB with AHSA1/START domain